MRRRDFREMREHVCRWAFVVGVTLAFMGCDRHGADRCAISGSVTLAGQPVDGGNIEFAPLAANQASASGAVIVAGRIPSPAKAGWRRASIASASTGRKKSPPSRSRPSSAIPGRKGPVAEQRPNAPLPKERIPAKCNVESELTVEVRQGVANTFDFPLSTGR